MEKKLDVEHDNCAPEIQHHARAMYEAYIKNSGGLSWDGKQCPTWDELGNPVRSHWCAAASVPRA